MASNTEPVVKIKAVFTRMVKVVQSVLHDKLTFALWREKFMFDLDKLAIEPQLPRASAEATARGVWFIKIAEQEAFLPFTYKEYCFWEKILTHELFLSEGNCFIVLLFHCFLFYIVGKLFFNSRFPCKVRDTSPCLLDQSCDVVCPSFCSIKILSNCGYLDLLGLFPCNGCHMFFKVISISSGKNTNQKWLRSSFRQQKYFL